MRFFSCLISFVSRCIAAACIESVGLYIANVLTFKRITIAGRFCFISCYSALCRGNKLLLMNYDGIRPMFFRKITTFRPRL